MLAKNSLRKIKKSFGRYLSLFFIVFIGVAFFSGLQATAPDITSAFQDYCDEHSLMDFEIISTNGLTEEDLSSISELDGISKIEAGYKLDMISDQQEISVYSLPEKINTVLLIEGSMPTASDECLADSSEYQIGDIVNIEDDDSQLIEDQFTVTGLIQSPLYLSTKYGDTSIGDGTLDSYIYIPEENFDLPAYTSIWLTLKDTASLDVFSDEYETTKDDFADELSDLAETREVVRDDELYDNAVNEIVDSSYGMLTFDQVASQFADELSSIEETTWYVQDRSSINGYIELDTAVDTIKQVSLIIPVFFLLIVALMTSNTMARMIVEERTELGTLSSLGVSDISMVFTYLGYVLSATMLGVISGFFAGSTIIPQIIYSTFSTFILPDIQIIYNFSVFLLVAFITIVLMGIVTISFCYMELHQMPSMLMRPSPPKHGQKILLERIGFFWKRLTFTWKITVRNIFRYKQRVLMTIIGISGCTALLMTGLGLNDSIHGVAEYQYSNIFTYDYLVVLNSSVSGTDELPYSDLESDGIDAPLYINQEVVTTGSNNQYDVYLYVPESENDINNYIHFIDTKDQSEVYLEEDQIFVTQNIAETLGLEPGDDITIEKDFETYTFTVDVIVDNYLGNYLYMSPDQYKSIFESEPEYQIVLGSDSDSDEEAFASSLLSHDDYLNITFTSDIIEQANNNTASLNYVIALIVVVAVFLAIIVLYNLTSINISERSREIATLKVLGFSDRESNQYIYREAIILTIISIFVGFILGYFLKTLVLNMIETDTSSYFNKTELVSYFYASGIIIMVSVFMQFVTYYKMKTINMIEALKSVE
jgi:putative ABC transport system permease protein